METRARQTARYRHPRRPRCRRRHRRCRRSPPHFAVWNGGLPHGRPLQLPPHGVTTRRGGGGNDPDGDGGGRTSSHPGGASRPRCPPHESGRASMLVVPAGAGGLLVGCGSTPAAVRPLTLRARKRGGQCHWQLARTGRTSKSLSHVAARPQHHAALDLLPPPPLDPVLTKPTEKKGTKKKH